MLPGKRGCSVYRNRATGPGEREDARFSCAAERNSGAGKEKEAPSGATANSVSLAGPAALPAAALPTAGERRRGGPAGLCPAARGGASLPQPRCHRNFSRNRVCPALFLRKITLINPKHSRRPPAPSRPPAPPCPTPAWPSAASERGRPGPRPTPHRRRRGPLLSPAPGRAPLRFPPLLSLPSPLTEKPAAGRAQPASPRKSFQV